MYILRFATMDMHGDMNEGRETVDIPASDAETAVREANDILSRHGTHSVPFMPTLQDIYGQLVARTIPQPPYARKLVWIAGSALGSQEEWVRV